MLAALATPSDRDATLLPATESPYTSLDPSSSAANVYRILLSATLGFICGCGGMFAYFTFSAIHPKATAHRRLVLNLLTSQPAPCENWEARCRAGAKAATAQGHGKFWAADLCSPGKRLSCAFRAPAWASPSVAELPASRDRHDADAEIGHVTATQSEDTLFLFLPGTGTPTSSVHSLLGAAADMGHHVIGLSYASLPTAVSMMNLWCTRPGANASLCNIEMHESVLFGRRTTAPHGASGIWDVPRAQSVAGLLRSGLAQLGWSQFLTAGGGGVLWERVVVSGHSQGASHAAYLSTVVQTKAAVLFSGPQEVAECASWLAQGPPTLRRAVYSMKEECGDEPEDTSSFCALYPQRLRRNLEAMGLTSGYVGNHSGFVVVDFPPLLNEGRAHHDSVALQTKAPPPVEALWKAMLGGV